MKKAGTILVILVVLSLGLALLAACTPPATTPPVTTPVTTTPTTTPPPTSATPATIALGGKLYDDWMKAAGVATPSGNSTL